MTPQRLTPIDILHLAFRRKWRGYAVQEIEDFRRHVAEELDIVLAESAEMRDRLRIADKELAHYRGLEGAMHEALIMAQKSADEIRNAARSSAEAHMQEANNRVGEAHQKLDMMCSERRRIICDLRATLNAQMLWLDRELEQEMGTQEVYSNRNSEREALPFPASESYTPYGAEPFYHGSARAA